MAVKTVPASTLRAWDRMEIPGYGRRVFTIISIREDADNRMRYFRVAGAREGALPNPVGIAYGGTVRKVVR